MTFYNPEAADGRHVLSEEESLHCVRVLRKRLGDVIQIMDGEGGIYDGEITEDHPRHCAYKVLSVRNVPLDPYHLHLGIAPTKNADRMEWMLEKCVEIGLHEITFLSCKNSGRTTIRLDRLEKKAIAAMKQSGRAFATRINPMAEFSDFASRFDDQWIRHIAYVPASEDSPHLKHTKQCGNYIILVGPEGDFSPEEIACATLHGYQPTSLGNSRLRTETAGLAVCHTLAVLHI